MRELSSLKTREINMSAYIFDGRRFAKEKELELKDKVTKLEAHGIVPKLVAILVGDDEASKLYISLKKKAAERVGINFEIIHLDKSDDTAIVQLIEQCNKDTSIHGILVQLPLPGSLDTKETTSRIVNSITPEKDVDGLTDTSTYTAATVKGVMYALREAQSENFLPKKLTDVNICVAGGTGIVGSSVVREL